MRNVIGFYIYFVGFEIFLDIGGNDILSWIVEKFYYNNVIYEIVEELMNVYDVGFKMVFEVFEDKGLFFIYKCCGDLQFKKLLRNLQIFELDGKWYMVSGCYVEYMGWSFDFCFCILFGIQFFNIKFKGDRIVYELSIQEVEVFYFGWSFKFLYINYFDVVWNMGFMIFELLWGVECFNMLFFLI